MSNQCKFLPIMENQCGFLSWLALFLILKWLLKFLQCKAKTFEICQTLKQACFLSPYWQWVSSPYSDRWLIRLSDIELLPYLAGRVQAQHQTKWCHTGHLCTLSQSDMLVKVSRVAARLQFCTIHECIKSLRYGLKYKWLQHSREV